MNFNLNEWWEQAEPLERGLVVGAGIALAGVLVGATVATGGAAGPAIAEGSAALLAAAKVLT
ncbi:MAG: hypothetical protein FJZ01_13110 [Candidatus Sericytochromatia bacterium]|nr:hypothetical protein [Candidatus Tanganyikabacteria bacterium]